MSTADARQATAAALSAVPGVTVAPYPVRTPRTGDGWVVLVRATPETFGSSALTLTAVVVCGPDEVAAEKKADEWLVPLLDAASSLGGDVVVETVSVAVGSTATPLYAITVTLTMEVE